MSCMKLKTGRFSEREELPTEQRPQDSKQQKRKLVGTVTDASSSDPLVGVSISVKNSPGTGTITDLDGKFSIEVSNNTELTFFLYRIQTAGIECRRFGSFESENAIGQRGAG